jgi:hypothetical protein
MSNRKNILELDNIKARAFFLKHESYCNIDLPKYFSFTEILEKLSQEVKDKNPYDFMQSKSAMGKCNNVNHLIYANKDGKLSWRPFQIIHPLAYVLLVHIITKKENWKKIQHRFKKFQKDSRIKCLSIPVQATNNQSDKAQQIMQWWEEVEQQSILLSLDYEYVFDTDIADCYSSIYTHSIAWAVETKCLAKSDNGRRDPSLLGNIIDKSIRDTQNEQTNGIPQGSGLMDFVAEIILGYIDRLLNFYLNKKDISKYQILRYRDDYRIFVTNYKDGEVIIKTLSEIIMPFGLKLNSNKTKGGADIITQSIKKDKLSWLIKPNKIRNLQKRLLVIRQHGIEYPNSGSLIKALNDFDKAIERRIESKKNISHTEQIISITTDIAFHNPKAIPICCAIISKLLSRIKNKSDISDKIFLKLNKMSNSGFAQIWLQRMLKEELLKHNITEKMCLLSSNQDISLWNNSWVKGQKITKILNKTPIFLQKEFDNLDNIIPNEEIYLFSYM